MKNRLTCYKKLFPESPKEDIWVVCQNCPKYNQCYTTSDCVEILSKRLYKMEEGWEHVISYLQEEIRLDKEGFVEHSEDAYMFWATASRTVLQYMQKLEEEITSWKEK